MFKFRLFLQDSLNDCSAACLSTILRYYGRYVTPVDLVKNMELSRGGASNGEVLMLAKRHGLEGKMIALPIDQFQRIEEPCLAYVKSQHDSRKHLVVLFQVKADKILVGDPARGKSWIPLQEFANSYLNVLLIFRKTQDFVAERLSDPYLLKFARFVGRYRMAILKTLALGTLTSMGAFGLIYFSKLFVDYVLPRNDVSLVVGFAVAFLLAKLCVIVLKGVNELLTVHIKNSLAKNLSSEFLNCSLDLEKKHIDNREVGDFLYQFSNINGLTEQIASYFSHFVLVVLGMTVKALILIFLYDPLLVSIILGVIAATGFVGFLFSRLTSEHANRRGLVFSHINTALLNALSDIRVVRVFNAEAWVRRTYRDLLEEGLALFHKITKLNVWGRSSAEILSIISEAAIFIICGSRILSGTYTIGDLLVFLSLAQALTNESLQFPGLILSFQNQLRSFARLQAVQELSLERQGGDYPSGESLEIEFRNVSFGYSKEVIVLKDLSFKLEAGKTTAIVGQSGSGKSTIVNLIMGFYKPWSGSILINGVNIAEIDLVRLRQDISAVFQQTPIFNKSLMANVTFEHTEVTPETVQDMAQLLGIDEFINKLPETYDQLIYEGYLSGGQTQRIGILRALVKPFKLLLLDEATSHLDSLTEERIVNGIHLQAQHKTRLVIAHRLSTVMEADQILVLHDGEVVESGKHEQLIEQAGPYLQLIERQYEINLTPATATF